MYSNLHSRCGHFDYIDVFDLIPPITLFLSRKNCIFINMDEYLTDDDKKRNPSWEEFIIAMEETYVEMTF